MTCIVGGPSPVGPPCQTITQGLVEAWKIDEGSGLTAAGELGVADLSLVSFDTTDAWWNVAGSTDSGRKFFGGKGVATLPPGLGLLANVGDGITVAIRRWMTGGGHVATPFSLEDIGFGSLEYDYLSLRGGPSGSGYAAPRIYASPTIDTSGGGAGPWPVVPGPLYRRATTPETIEGSRALGCPTQYPALDEPTPYLAVVTLVVIAPGQVTASLFGRDEAGSFLGVCHVTGANGDIDSEFTSPPGDAVINPTFSQAGLDASLLVQGGTAFGTPSGYGDLRELTIGGGNTIPLDTIHQAALWSRALSSAEVMWLLGTATDGGNLDALFASIDDPGSQCGGSTCDETAGISGDNPLISVDGNSAIRPDFVNPRRDSVGITASEGANLRETARAHETTPRVYELVWSEDDGKDAALVLAALRKTRGGARPTRWRHPIDDPAPPENDPICTCPRWRIVGAEGAGLTRGPGGTSGAMRLTLEEIV
jgi:hypothetical protein